MNLLFSQKHSLSMMHTEATQWIYFLPFVEEQEWTIMMVSCMYICVLSIQDNFITVLLFQLHKNKFTRKEEIRWFLE